MKTYEIQVYRHGKWERFLYWWGMKHLYALGAFRMLKGFSTDERYRLINSEGEVIEEAKAPTVPEVANADR